MITKTGDDDERDLTLDHLIMIAFVVLRLFGLRMTSARLMLKPAASF